jgi:hypothetical protein
MAFEIDYIPVGDEEKGADAIALRFGNLTGQRNEQKVIVIDGGFKESGEKLVKHIKDFYNTDHVDIVFKKLMLNFFGYQYAEQLFLEYLKI